MINHNTNIKNLQSNITYDSYISSINVLVIFIINSRFRFNICHKNMNCYSSWINEVINVEIAFLIIYQLENSKMVLLWEPNIPIINVYKPYFIFTNLPLFTIHSRISTNNGKWKRFSDLNEIIFQYINANIVNITRYHIHLRVHVPILPIRHASQRLLTLNKITIKKYQEKQLLSFDENPI